ncbi:MAG TPA: RNA methyltransferase [Gemmatimonadales bacterium]|nr:RNA methyltransferase [Gemmatimonadales bacterium]
MSAIFILNGQVDVSLISTIRDLHRRRARERRALALAEGIRLLEEALDAGVSIQGAAVAPALEATARGDTLKRRLVGLGVPLEAVEDSLLAELADTEHPQGVVAVVEPPSWEPTDIVPSPAGVVLVLDGVQDPGNVGALARTALAFGAKGLIALPGTGDLWSPKALRGAMGAMFRLPAVPMSIASLVEWARKEQLELWTSSTTGTAVGEVERRGPVALVVGNEGAGISPDLEAVADRRVTVPIASAVESLNVAVAAGILLYEVTRVR